LRAVVFKGASINYKKKLKNMMMASSVYLVKLYKFLTSAQKLVKALL
jgi:hypothetical protein